MPGAKRHSSIFLAVHAGTWFAQAHGGQGAAAAGAFDALPVADKQALLAFLGCI
jgi:hypothetical protein